MTKEKTLLKISKAKAEKFRGQVLAWYDKNGREFPWRVRRCYEDAGVDDNAETSASNSTRTRTRTKATHIDPYKIWLSEIMCQQTTVQAVIPYYLKFLKKWPSVFDLASAPREQVLDMWAGLGYYARARNLHACAQAVAKDYDGVFPCNAADLKALPGIGDYTSAAIAAIVYDEAVPVVDGNVERVMARFFAIEEPLPKSKPALKSAAALVFNGCEGRAGDFAQSLMDLGAMVCSPKSPKCNICPVQDMCKGYARGVAHDLPKKEKKKPKPHKYGYVYWIENDLGGCVHLERRPDDVMLGGMLGLPTSDWVRHRDELKHPDFISAQTSLGQGAFVKHSFTHFDLTLYLYKAVAKQNFLPSERYALYNTAELQNKRIATVFQKGLLLFLKHWEVETKS